MKVSKLVLILPFALVLSACAGHYRGHGGGYGAGYGHGNVSIGVHGDLHSNAAAVVGALAVGAIVGHALTAAANQEKGAGTSSAPMQSDKATDELVNGYSIGKNDKSSAKPLKNKEQARFYQKGQDGNCYLMEKKGEQVNVISMVPSFSCD